MREERKNAIVTLLLDTWSVFILAAACYRLSKGTALSYMDAAFMGVLVCFAVKLAAHGVRA